MENKNLTKQMNTWKEQLLDIGKCFSLSMYNQIDSNALSSVKEYIPFNRA